MSPQCKLHSRHQLLRSSDPIHSPHSEKQNCWTPHPSHADDICSALLPAHFAGRNIAIKRPETAPGRTDNVQRFVKEQTTSVRAKTTTTLYRKTTTRAHCTITMVAMPTMTWRYASSLHEALLIINEHACSGP